MKIIDRYILASFTGAFLFGVGLFMTMLMAMNLLRKVIEMIAEQGVPAGTALLIFALRLPSMLLYAFPMAVLLGILLVFNRMSSDSEMVAIRAAGVSFMRLVMPALFFAVIITGITFWLSDAFAPYASQKAATLLRAAIDNARHDDRVQSVRSAGGQTQYAFLASGFDSERMELRGLTVLFYRDIEDPRDHVTKRLPYAYLYADSARWEAARKTWRMTGTRWRPLAPNAANIYIEALDEHSALEYFTSQFKENPIDIIFAKKEPDEFTTDEMREYIAHLQGLDGGGDEHDRWVMRLAQRYAAPFTCLVFTLIGAPLGLRHHRTSSAMGLGMSLLLILVYYTIFNYLQLLGDNGRVDPYLAAWLPNIIGGGAGVALMFRANQ